jgi:hypothetical protein
MCRITVSHDPLVCHKGLKRLFEEDDTGGLNAEHTDKLRRVLARMDSAKVIADMDLPGYSVPLVIVRHGQLQYPLNTIRQKEPLRLSNRR